MLPSTSWASRTTSGLLLWPVTDSSGNTTNWTPAFAVSSMRRRCASRFFRKSRCRTASCVAAAVNFSMTRLLLGRRGGSKPALVVFLGPSRLPDAGDLHHLHPQGPRVGNDLGLEPIKIRQVHPPGDIAARHPVGAARRE